VGTPAPGVFRGWCPHQPLNIIALGEGMGVRLFIHDRAAQELKLRSNVKVVQKKRKAG